jgi:hypothetical protein
MTHSQQNPVDSSISLNNNSSDPETVFNKILDSVCEVYFSIRGEKNSQKLLETILHLRKLKESINFSR